MKKNNWKKKLTQSNYIIGDGKILFCFNYKNNNYYEIGHFINNNNDFNFAIEYLITEDKNKANILNIFKAYGIKEMIKKFFPQSKQNEIIILKNNRIGYYYPIEENNSFLMSVYFFEKDFLNKENESKNKNNNNEIKDKKENNPFCNEQIHLINKSFYSNIKKLLSYDIFIDFINENKIKSDKDIYENNIKHNFYYD